jgi:RNA ligase (TIGR02306 family)
LLSAIFNLGGIDLSTFNCQARRVQIEVHPNADAIELARVDDYISIVRKGEYQDGDLAVYIPEQAIVPEEILLALNFYEKDEDGTPKRYENGNLAGGLSGPAGNRVKAMRLRGIVSQGILYRPEGLELTEGEDYAEVLGVTKWLPQIPTDMSGTLVPQTQLRGYTDIENIKSYPGVLEDGELVVATEKIHGTATILGLDVQSGELAVSSKGFAKQGLGIVDEKEWDGRSKNLYWRSAYQHDLPAKIAALATLLKDEAKEVIVLYGETYGVQDLRYGSDTGEPGFVAFDIAVDGQYLDYPRFVELTEAVGIVRVPPLYEGPYSAEAIWAVASGKEQMTGQELNIREGVVVRPLTERHDLEAGRVIFKAVSDDYLLRKNKDATEFE